MKLAQLAQRLPGARLIGGGDVAIAAVRADSRAVEPGDLFVCVRGLRSDGHRFAEAAVAAGAAALVVERPLEAVAAPQLVVESSAEALGVLAAARAGDPAASLRLVGITGTNGKTTTTYLVESILLRAGLEPGVIGTVSYRYGGREHPAPYTTPTPELLHRSFGDMIEAGSRSAVLEVSSHALVSARLAGVAFEVAAFSNLTQDHLDFHGDMAGYRAAKALLFSQHLAAGGVAVINIDDPAAGAMIAAAGERRVLRVSAAGAAEAEVRVSRSSATIDGVAATIDTPRGPIEVKSPVLLGRFNVDNLALAVGIAEALGIDHADVAAGIASLPGVPGRLERVENDRGLDILVDYAHTPAALAKALAALRPLTQRRLIAVFGCGGDRDPGKRPLMGAAAAAAADLVVVTSDNPRTEDPEAIIDMILPAVGDPFYVDADRRRAIAVAVGTAAPGDVVLIAGKGHEDYQILGEERIHFDDREEAAAAAAARAKTPLEALAEAVDGSVTGDGATLVDRVVIDGRAAARGDLYVAIRGERFDGHDFCDQAIAAGAAAVMVERGRSEHTPRIEVADTQLALGRIGRHARRRWGKTVIGVTGSAGKTTTKELIAAALRGRHVHKSRGSHNNETGVPLTLLGLSPAHDVAVLEMGMRGLGQIDYLCEIAEPDVGVVVNAGTAHVGVVGSAEDILRGKAEMFGRLPAGGTAVYPADDPRFRPYAAAAPRALSFGESEGADVRLLEYRPRAGGGSQLRIGVAGDAIEVELQLSGRHSAIDACCALAAAMAAGAGAAEAARYLAAARPAAMRGQLIELAGRRILLDCYNSNPAALEAALTTLAELATADGRRGHAVIGDMLELGDHAGDAHREAGRQATALGIGVVALGELAAAVVEGAPEGVHAHSPAEAAEAVWERAAPGDWILLKASRGAKLERVLEAMRELEPQG